MSIDSSLNALRDANPRNQPDFDASLERFHDLETQITASPPDPARRTRPANRRRLVSVSLGAAVAIGLAIAASLSLGGGSPQSAYAAARHALTATSAQRSGTVTLTVNGTPLYTERWNGSRIALKKAQSSPLVLGHVLGPNLQMVLVGGSAYVQGPTGTWTHYASEADLGDKLGTAPHSLRANMRGNTVHEILSAATHLHRSSGPGGTTIYTGTIRNAHLDPQENLSQDEVTAMIAKLRGAGASDPNAPGGTYPNRAQLSMVVGRNGLVQMISFIFRQPSCQAGVPNCTQSPASSHGSITWSVRYSHLGDNQPVTAPVAAAK